MAVHQANPADVDPRYRKLAYTLKHLMLIGMLLCIAPAFVTSLLEWWSGDLPTRVTETNAYGNAPGIELCSAPGYSDLEVYSVKLFLADGWSNISAVTAQLEIDALSDKRCLFINTQRLLPDLGDMAHINYHVSTIDLFVEHNSSDGLLVTVLDDNAAKRGAGFYQGQLGAQLLGENSNIDDTGLTFPQFHVEKTFHKCDLTLGACKEHTQYRLVAAPTGVLGSYFFDDKAEILMQPNAAQPEKFGTSFELLFDKSTATVLTTSGLLRGWIGMASRLGGYLAVTGVLFSTCFVRKYPNSQVVRNYDALTLRTREDASQVRLLRESPEELDLEDSEATGSTEA